MPIIPFVLQNTWIQGDLNEAGSIQKMIKKESVQRSRPMCECVCFCTVALATASKGPKTAFNKARFYHRSLEGELGFGEGRPVVVT